MPADALATLGARASTGMVLTPQGRDIQFPSSEELMKFRINAIAPSANELTHGGLVMPCTTSKVQVITVSANCLLANQCQAVTGTLNMNHIIHKTLQLVE